MYLYFKPLEPTTDGTKRKGFEYLVQFKIMYDYLRSEKNEFIYRVSQKKCFFCPVLSF